MPSTIEATIRTHLTMVETLTGDYISSDNATVTVNGMDTTAVLNAGTTPPATKGTAFRVTMTGSAVSINLQALTGITGDETIVGTGLKVQAVKFRNKLTNSGSISVTEGASNGHPLLGASFLFELLPGQSLTLQNEGVDVGTDIANGDKTWDCTGTNNDLLEVEIIMG